MLLDDKDRSSAHTHTDTRRVDCGPGRSLLSTIALSDLPTADPEGFINPSSVDATIEQSISFTCNVSGYPLPTVTQWSLADDTRMYQVGAQTLTSRIQVKLVVLFSYAYLFNSLSKPTMSTQPRTPPGWLNRVPALIGWGKGGTVTLPGGR